jgi:hypothetical protein
MKKIICLLLIALFFSNSSFAANELNVRTGNDLYNLYKSSKKIKLQNNFDMKDVMKASMYSGFVSGVAGVMLINGVNHQNPSICIGSNTTIEQYEDTLGIYLENHPEERNESALLIINRAFPVAFPCQQSGRK